MKKFQFFFLNGQKYKIQTNIKLNELLNYFNYDQIPVIVEYNKVIYSDEICRTVYIRNNDKIEILTIVGGG